MLKVVRDCGLNKADWNRSFVPHTDTKKNYSDDIARCWENQI